MADLDLDLWPIPGPGGRFIQPPLEDTDDTYTVDPGYAAGYRAGFHAGQRTARIDAAARLRSVASRTPRPARTVRKGPQKRVYTLWETYAARCDGSHHD